jgi:branched-chain amino acid transport system substrate-binding protein
VPLTRSLRRLAASLLASASLTASAFAQGPAKPPLSDGVVKIAVLADLAGATSDYAGTGAIEAVKMAVEDFGRTQGGLPVETVFVDHQNKPDVAVAKARELFDTQGVDMVINLSNSSAALAVVEVGRLKKRVTIVTAAGSGRITNENCSPYAVHYVFNVDSLANSITAPLIKAGHKDWFLLVADFAYGLSLEKTVTDIVKGEGGRVVGAVKHPFIASDFSSLVVQAQSSGAQVIGLSNSSADTVNSIKTLNEFGVMGGKQKVVAFTVLINDVHGVGLDVAKGLQFAASFYWDRTDETRAWSKRFSERVKRMPNMVNAGDYSATLHYLKAVKAAGTDDPDAVMAKMRELPVDDMFAKGGRIRPDGLHVHDVYVMEVKKPSESKYPWDYYHVRATVPGDQAYRPLSASLCPLVKS